MKVLIISILALIAIIILAVSFVIFVVAIIFGIKYLNSFGVVSQQFTITISPFGIFFSIKSNIFIKHHFFAAFII